MKRVVCFVWLTFQASNLFSADQYEHRRLFLQIQKVTGLPSEVLHRIATFLDFDDRETDEEFVARASALKTIKKEHKEKVVDLKMPWQEVFNQKEASLSYAFDGKKIYRFCEVKSVGAHGDSRDIQSAHLGSIALEPEVSLLKTMPAWNAFFGFSPQVSCFAVSRDETQCAQLILYGKFSQGYYSNSDNISPSLKYKNLNDGADHEIVITKNYGLFQSIAFNKQGTKIIMFALHNSSPDNASRCADGAFYHIFPIVSGPEAEKQNQKTLLGYLNQLIAKYPNN